MGHLFKLMDEYYLILLIDRKRQDSGSIVFLLSIFIDVIVEKLHSRPSVEKKRRNFVMAMSLDSLIF